MQAQEKVYVSGAYKTMKSVAVKKQPLKANLAKPMRLKSVLRADIPDGMAQITLTAGDLWEDGSGYQMLLDADATAYGTLFQATGGLTTSGSADASVYNEFEYKIPENADGDLNTSNVVITTASQSPFLLEPMTIASPIPLLETGFGSHPMKDPIKVVPTILSLRLVTTMFSPSASLAIMTV